MIGSAYLEGIVPGHSGAAGSATSLASPEPAAALLARLSEKGRSGSLTLGELLRPLAERGGVDIHVARDGWIGFQSTRPFRAPDRQIDPAVLREVFGPAIDEKGLKPENAMLAGRRLTRPQMETLSAPYLGFPRHLTQNSGLRSALDAWRMLDRFSARDRQALFDGIPVRYARLDPRGQMAATEYIRSVSARPNGAPLDLELGPRDLPSLQFWLGKVTNSARSFELRLPGFHSPAYQAALEAEWPPVRSAQ